MPHEIDISKLPDEVKARDFFYVHPLPSVPIDDSKPWFAVSSSLKKHSPVNDQGYVY